MFKLIRLDTALVLTINDTRVCKFIVIDEKLKFRHTSIIQKIRQLEGLGLV